LTTNGQISTGLSYYGQAYADLLRMHKYPRPGGVNRQTVKDLSCLSAISMVSKVVCLLKDPKGDWSKASKKDLEFMRFIEKERNI